MLLLLLAHSLAHLLTLLPSLSPQLLLLLLLRHLRSQLHTISIYPFTVVHRHPKHTAHLLNVPLLLGSTCVYR